MIDDDLSKKISQIISDSPICHCHCHDCGMQYGGDNWVETVIPDKVWNRIKPSECGDGAGILCIHCIARRLIILGYLNVPVWLCGTEPLKAIGGDQSECIDILRNWDINH